MEWLGNTDYKVTEKTRYKHIKNENIIRLLTIEIRMEPFEPTSRMPTGMDHYTHQGVTNYQPGQRSITPSGKEMKF